jgi:hypothetical protein
VPESGCQCVSCSECGGSGRIWLDVFGNYLGNRRCDDLDEMETCMECSGSGLADGPCLHCELAEGSQDA